MGLLFLSLEHEPWIAAGMDTKEPGELLQEAAGARHGGFLGTTAVEIKTLRATASLLVGPPSFALLIADIPCWRNPFGPKSLGEWKADAENQGFVLERFPPHLFPLDKMGGDFF